MKSISKQEEINILRAAVADLGPDSYCGPWLQSVIGNIEQTIKGDILPTITPSECAAQIRGVVERAKEDVKEIMNDARKEAYRIVANAISETRGPLQVASNKLKAATKDVDERLIRLESIERSLRDAANHSEKVHIFIGQLERKA
jgi:vacuolar-type H+-ATPase subunit H